MSIRTLSRPLRPALPPTALAWVLMCCIALVAALGAIVFSGTRFGVALALTAVFGPLALNAALRAPLVFPFALFLLLVPFDNLLSLSSFGTLTKLIGLACDAAFILWLMRTRSVIQPGRAVVAWFVFVVFAIVSLTWAADPTRGIPSIASLGALFVLYAVLSFMKITRAQLTFVAGTIVAGGAVAGAYGAYLFHRGVGVSQDGRLFVADQNGNIDPNHFAAAMLVPLVTAIVFFVYASNVRTRVLAALGGGFIAVGILVAGSRGAIVAAVVMFLYLLIRSERRVVLSGMALSILALGVGMFGKIADRFSQAAATGGAGRLGIWKVGVAAFKAHPIGGIGIGNFAIAYNDAFLTVPAFSSMKVIEGAHWNVAPHNNLVWIGVELGIVGVVSLLAAWWLQFRALRVVARSNSVYPFRLASEAALLGMFVAGLFLGTLTYKYLWLGFILAALTRNAALCEEKAQREVDVSSLLPSRA